MGRKISGNNQGENMKYTRFLMLLFICISTMAMSSSAGLKPGAPAPDFTLNTAEARVLRSAAGSGGGVTLSDFTGQVVILHFWKSNWRQCHAEISHLKKIAEKYPEEQVKILSLNAINPSKQVAAEAKRYKIPFPVLVCRETGVVRDYQITKLPHLFIIDQEGVIRESSLFLKTEKIEEVVDNLLAEQETATSRE